MSAQRLTPEFEQQTSRQVSNHGCSVVGFQLEHVL